MKRAGASERYTIERSPALQNCRKIALAYGRYLLRDSREVNINGHPFHLPALRLDCDARRRIWRADGALPEVQQYDRNSAPRPRGVASRTMLRQPGGKLDAAGRCRSFS